MGNDTLLATIIRRLTSLEKKYERSQSVPTRIYTSGDFLGTLMSIPDLRGLWGGSFNESGNLYDYSGQGRTLTNNGTTPRLALDTCVPYASLNGSTRFFSRADEAGLDLTGSFTIGGWFYASTAATAVCMAKAGNAPTISYQIAFIAPAAQNFQFIVSSNGTAVTAVSGTEQYVVGRWYFLMMRYDASTSLTAFINGNYYTNVTSIPASVFNSASSFRIGANDAGNYLNGRSSIVFAYARILSDTMMNNLFTISRGLYGV